MFFVQNEQSDVLSTLFSVILTLCARYFRLPNGKIGVLRQPENHSIGRNECRAAVFYGESNFSGCFTGERVKKSPFSCVGRTKTGERRGKDKILGTAKAAGDLSYRFTKTSCGFLNYPSFAAHGFCLWLYLPRYGFQAAYRAYRAV